MSAPPFPEPFSTRVADVDGTGLQVLTCEGELDLATAPDLVAAINAATAPRLVIDLSGVSFMDSTGIAALLGAQRRHPDGSLALCCPPGAPLRSLQILGLLDLLVTRDSVEDAIGALDGAG